MDGRARRIHIGLCENVEEHCASRRTHRERGAAPPPATFACAKEGVEADWRIALAWHGPPLGYWSPLRRSPTCWLTRRLSLSQVSILHFRRRVGAPVVGNPQLPVQVGPAARTALHLLGQTRLGAVFLQGGPPGGERAHAQKPAGTNSTDSFHVTPFHSLPNCSRLAKFAIVTLKGPFRIQVFIIMNPIDLNLEPPILAVSSEPDDSDTAPGAPPFFSFTSLN